MNLFMALFTGTVRALLFFVEICFLIRAVLSWFPIREDHPILLLVAMITEPIVAPVRALLDRLGWFRNLPIDMSFFVAYLLLILVESLLGIFLW